MYVYNQLTPLRYNALKEFNIQFACAIKVIDIINVSCNVLRAAIIIHNFSLPNNNYHGEVQSRTNARPVKNPTVICYHLVAVWHPQL